MAAPAPAAAAAARNEEFAWAPYRAQAIRDAEAFVQEILQLVSIHPDGEWDTDDEHALEIEYEQIQDSFQDAASAIQEWNYIPQPVMSEDERVRQLEIQTLTGKTHVQLLVKAMRHWYMGISYEALRGAQPHLPDDETNLADAWRRGFILSIQAHTKSGETFFPITPLSSDAKFTCAMVHARKQQSPSNGPLFAEAMRQFMRSRPSPTWYNSTPEERVTWETLLTSRLRVELNQLRADELDGMGWAVYNNLQMAKNLILRKEGLKCLKLLQTYMQDLLDLYHAEQANLARLMERKHRVPRVLILHNILPFIVDQPRMQMRGGPGQSRLVARSTNADQSMDQQYRALYHALKRKEDQEALDETEAHNHKKSKEGGGMGF